MPAAAAHAATGKLKPTGGYTQETSSSESPMPLHVRFFVFAVVLAASACGSSNTTSSGGNPSPAGPVADVSMTDNNGLAPYAFSPATLNIKVGTRVRWTNSGKAQHTATSDATPQPVWSSGTVEPAGTDRKSTRLNSSHLVISYAVFCLKKKNKEHVTSGLPVADNELTGAYATQPCSTPPRAPSYIAGERSLSAVTCFAVVWISSSHVVR